MKRALGMPGLAWGLAVASLLHGRAWGAEGAAFMKVPQGARAAAMGGAFSSVPHDAEAFWYNPAAIAGVDGAALGFSHAHWLGDTASEYLYAAYGHGAWGLGVNAQYASAEDLSRDSLGNAGNTFSLLDMAVGVGGAYKIGPLSLGAAGKMIRLGVKDSAASAFAADLGAQALLWNGHVSTGLAVRNLGSAPEPGHGNSGVNPPTDLRFGLGLLDLQGFSFLSEYRYWTESALSSVGVGGEFDLHVGAAHLGLRAGYESALGGNGAGLTAGVGAGFGAINVDYAYQNVAPLGAVNRFAVNWQWSASPQPAQPVGPASLSERQAAKQAFETANYVESARLYEGLTKREPDNAKFENSLGLSLWRQGQKRAALPHFERSLQLDPQQPSLRTWLEKVRGAQSP